MFDHKGLLTMDPNPFSHFSGPPALLMEERNQKKKHPGLSLINLQHICRKPLKRLVNSWGPKRKETMKMLSTLDIDNVCS